MEVLVIQTVISNRRLIMVAAAILAIGDAGCVHRPETRGAPGGSLCAVSLPALQLAAGESIQSVEVDIADGRIASINRTWDDWDMELNWDTPGNLAWKCTARHFSAGFQSTRGFERFITVQVGPTSYDGSGPPSFDIMATVRTDSTGRGGREYHIFRSELVLSPMPNAAFWRTRSPGYPCLEPGAYIVRWGNNAADIAGHFHLTMAELSGLNSGADLSHLKIGQQLHVSAGTGK